jgi:hypothetical protein
LPVSLLSRLKAQDLEDFKAFSEELEKEWPVLLQSLCQVL